MSFMNKLRMLLVKGHILYNAKVKNLFNNAKFICCFLCKAALPFYFVTKYWCFLLNCISHMLIAH